MINIIKILTLLVGFGCSKSKDEDKTAPSPKQPVPMETEQPKQPQPTAFEDFEVDLGSISNLGAITQRTGTDKLHEQGFYGQNIRIAIFDNGYSGLNHSSGKRLPQQMKVMPFAGNALANSSHGTKMAEIIYGVASGLPQWTAESKGPQLFLYNTNGFSNLKTAVKEAVLNKIDVILYAQVWEYGDNDGTDGFINDVVRQATDAGILWINASGNFGESAYRSGFTIPENGSIQLPWEDKYLRMYVAVPKTNARIVLAWNDFDKSPDYRSPQNLDLHLFDSSMKNLASSLRDQNGGRDSTHSLFSAHAREILTVPLEAGIYYLGVDAKSRNFDSDAILTIAADGPGISFPDATGGDSLMAPAGNPGVLAVGAIDSRNTSVRIVDGKIVKPEVFVESAISFTDGTFHEGTSSASAIMTGAIAVWLSANGKVGLEKVRSAIETGLISASTRDFCLSRNQGCYPVPVLNFTNQ